MDKRNSKESMLEEIKELEERLAAVYVAGQDGIEYVGQRNISGREDEAIRKLQVAMYD